MIHSNQLHNLELPDFSVLYEESYIASHVEQIICLVLEKAYVEKSKILRFDIRDISDCHHKRLLDKLRTRLRVSSIYITNDKLYVDWSV